MGPMMNNFSTSTMFVNLRSGATTILAAPGRTSYHPSSDVAEFVLVRADQPRRRLLRVKAAPVVFPVPNAKAPLLCVRVKLTGPRVARTLPVVENSISWALAIPVLIEPAAPVALSLPKVTGPLDATLPNETAFVVPKLKAFLKLEEFVRMALEITNTLVELKNSIFTSSFPSKMYLAVCPYPTTGNINSNAEIIIRILTNDIFCVTDEQASNHKVVW
jgi:hypothetical protein